MSKRKDKQAAIAAQQQATVDGATQDAAAAGAPQQEAPKVVVHRIGNRVVRRFHLYERTKSATGHSSRDTADATAMALRGQTLDEIYAVAAQQLKVPEQDLRAKYARLNVGMQRMNLGNRMRAAQAKATVA